MQVIIYHNSSFGGTYEHAQHLKNAYDKLYGEGFCEVVLPSISKVKGRGYHKILLTDLPTYKIGLFRKFQFLLRVYFNPLLFLWFIKDKKGAYILWNEFEQFSGWFYLPFLRWIKKSNKQVHSIILHDPDRDAYNGSPTRSAWFMSKIMLPMDIGFYHELLPEKSYYQGLPATKFVNVMLGLMPKHPISSTLINSLKEEIGERKVISILGNIRWEKNYHLAIKLLKDLPNVCIIIGGRAANSSVNLEELHNLAKEQGVSHQIIWLTRFLSDEELATIITLTDISWLYYSASFKSQSGVLTLVAPYRKPIFASAGESALAIIVDKYALGCTAPPDDSNAALLTINKMLAGNIPNGNWEAFESFAQWEVNVKTSIAAFKEVTKYKR